MTRCQSSLYKLFKNSKKAFVFSYRSILRAAVVFLCIFHLGLPLLRSLFTSTKDGDMDSTVDTTTTYSPRQQQEQQDTITLQRLPEDDLIPGDILHLSYRVLKEATYWLLCKFLYINPINSSTQQDTSSKIRQWTKLVELECVKTRKLKEECQFAFPSPSLSTPSLLSTSWLKYQSFV